MSLKLLKLFCKFDVSGVSINHVDMEGGGGLVHKLYLLKWSTMGEDPEAGPKCQKNCQHGL